MLIYKTVKIRGVDLTKTYSSRNVMIKRDGILYDVAYDPTSLQRKYEETDIPLPDGYKESITKWESKIDELKRIRDAKELEPIEYNGNLFDFDEKSYSRITAAIYALDIIGGTIAWTTADNNTVNVSSNDLRGVIANAAARSNALHIKYREYRERVDSAQTEEEIDAIVWED